MTAAAIVNPQAAAGAARRRWPAVAQMLESCIGKFSVRFTERAGHAEELARELAEAGCDPIIAAGGDGTSSEVANGILASGRDVRLGLMPLASGGDFARTFGLTRVRCAVEALAAGHTRAVDVLRLCYCAESGPAGRYCLNVASAGLGGEAARGAGGWRRRLPGNVRYLAAAVPHLARAYEVSVWVDGVGAGTFRTTTLAIANGRYQGGGIAIAPEAAIDDGLLDLTLIEQVGLGEVAANLRRLYSGTLLAHPKVRHWRGACVRVEGRGEVPLEVDGDPAGRLPLEATVLPGALRLISP